MTWLEEKKKTYSTSIGLWQLPAKGYYKPSPFSLPQIFFKFLFVLLAECFFHTSNSLSPLAFITWHLHYRFPWVYGCTRISDATRLIHRSLMLCFEGLRCVFSICLFIYSQKCIQHMRNVENMLLDYMQILLFPFCRPHEQCLDWI